MAYFRYIGDPKNFGEGPETTELFGHAFPKGDPVEVTDGHAMAKIAGNRHFEAMDEKAAAAALGAKSKAAAEAAKAKAQDGDEG